MRGPSASSGNVTGTVIVRLSPLRPNDRVPADPDHDVQVAGGPAADAGLALAGQPDPLPVLDPRRDAGGHAYGCDTIVRSPWQVGTRRVDDRPGALAVGARLGERERTLVTGDQSGPVADRALARAGSRLRAAAVAGRTRDPLGQPQRDGDAVTASVNASETSVSTSEPRRLRLARAELARRLNKPPKMSPRPPSAAPSAGTGLPEQVAEIEAGTTRHPRRNRREAAEGTGGHQVARLVVLLALVVVGQHVIGLGDGLELLLGLLVAGVLVRVQVPGQLAVGLLDLGARSRSSRRRARRRSPSRSSPWRSPGASLQSSLVAPWSPDRAPHRTVRPIEVRAVHVATRWSTSATPPGSSGGLDVSSRVGSGPLSRAPAGSSRSRTWLARRRPEPYPAGTEPERRPVAAGIGACRRRPRFVLRAGHHHHRRAQHPVAQRVAAPEHRRHRRLGRRPPTCRTAPPRAPSGRTASPAVAERDQALALVSASVNRSATALNGPARSPCARARSRSSSTDEQFAR